jgi:hypothetical protein
MLDRLAAAWRRRWWAAAALGTLATIVLAAAIGRALGYTAAGAAVAGAVTAALVLLTGWRHRPLVDARTAARHLNRTWPELEESAELLVTDEQQLSPVERLQRERARRALERLAALAPPRLPHRPLRWALWYAGAASVGALALLLATGGRSLDARAPDAPAGVRRALALGDVAVEVHPPAYTGLPRRRQRGWEIEAVAGSAVRWQLETTGTVTAGVLIASTGDTVPLAPAGDGRFTAALTPERSALYYVTLRDSAGTAVTSDFHALTVIPDAAPTVTVLSPEPRTLIQPGAPAAVALRVLVGDDYGIAETRLLATLTTGQGEGVKFREQELEFERTGPRPDRRPGALLERQIDARALGLGPGDELYFHVTVRDVRRPVPNETRSETYFITLVDTAQALLADFSGLAVNLVPEYFRSQRQIIIDTERLLAERAGIPVAEFRARSENIGLDQHLLRLRYGEIVGDEVVAGDADPQDTHQHDIEDNATRLAPQVKATLQASLAQMWEAELRLRTSDPQAALPFEYRALELLKEVQQAARVYVRRVGFEPPPLEPDRKRLSGDLSKIGRPTVARDAVSRDSLAAVRGALAIVRRLAAGGTSTGGDLTVLERAGQELAGLAVQDPGRHLETLRRLRELLDGVRAGSGCADCLPALEAGLARALPVPAPAAGAAPPAGGLGRAYFDLLRAP